MATLSRRTALAVLLATLCTACKPQTKGKSPTKQEVTLKLGLSGADFALALGREDARVNRQPAGLNFYKLG